MRLRGCACMCVGGLIAAVHTSSAFVWPLQEHFSSEDGVKLTFSEMYMFGTNDGPALMSSGDAYIHLDATLKIITQSNQSMDVSVVFYAVQYDYRAQDVMKACNRGTDSIDNFISSFKKTFLPTWYDHELTEEEIQYMITAPESGLRYYLWAADLQSSFTVAYTSWHNVLLELCDTNIEGAALSGTIAFKNPYGFLPGMFYGFLPFAGAGMVAYILFGVFYFLSFLQHRESLLPLHSAILAVFILATLEATVWFVAYTHINNTGEPYCCPFPGTVAAGMILEALRSTLSRAVLLCVCLGYGVVRPKLHPTEWVAIATMTMLYLASALIDESSRIVREDSVKGGEARDVSVGWQIPVLIFDILFLTWIYLALTSTIRILNDLNQTFKLQMYKRLATAIAIFVSLFALLTLLISFHDIGLLPWPWQWVWVQSVLWDLLNFGVLAAVCLIWRPSDNAKYLSYSSELPTSDPDEDEPWNDDVSGLPRSRAQMEMAQGRSRRKVNNHAPGQFDSLPLADEDGEFGLEEEEERY